MTKKSFAFIAITILILCSFTAIANSIELDNTDKNKSKNCKTKKELSDYNIDCNKTSEHWKTYYITVLMEFTGSLFDGVKEEWDGTKLKRVWVHVSVDVRDDVGLDKVEIKVQDNGLSETIYANGAKYITATADIDIDYWSDAKWDFTVVATAYDVNGNLVRVYNIGGLKKEISDFFALIIFQFDPMVIGGVIGFFTSLAKNFYEDITMIFHIGEMIEGITKIKDLLGKDIINQLISGMKTAIEQAAKSVNPFKVDTTQWIEFNIGYIGGSITGTVMYMVLSMVISPGAAIAKSIATVGKALGAVGKMVGVGAKVGKIAALKPAVMQKISKIGKRIDDSVKALRITKRVATRMKEILDRAIVRVVHSYRAEKIAEIMAKYGLKETDEVIEGMNKFMRRVGTKKVDEFVGRFGKELSDDTFTITGKSISTWSDDAAKALARSVERYGDDVMDRVVGFAGKDASKVVRNIDEFKDVTNIGGRVGELSKNAEAFKAARAEIDQALIMKSRKATIKEFARDIYDPVTGDRITEFDVVGVDKYGERFVGEAKSTDLASFAGVKAKMDKFVKDHVYDKLEKYSKALKTKEFEGVKKVKFSIRKELVTDTYFKKVFKEKINLARSNFKLDIEVVYI